MSRGVRLGTSRRDGVEHVPVRPPGAQPQVAYAVLGVLAVIIGGAALASDGLFSRVALGCGALLMAMAALYVSALASAASPGVVRVEEGAPLTLVPPRAVAGWELAIAVVGLLPGTFVWLGAANGERTLGGQGAIWLSILTVAAAAWLVKQVAELAVPRGLTIAPEGLSGVRGGRRFAWSWDELARASVVLSRTGARLVLHAHDHEPVEVDPTRMGSDPNTVAAVVEYFRSHPDERAALAADGHEVLAAVERALE